MLCAPSCQALPLIVHWHGLAAAAPGQAMTKNVARNIILLNSQERRCGMGGALRFLVSVVVLVLQSGKGVISNVLSCRSYNLVELCLDDIVHQTYFRVRIAFCPAMSFSFVFLSCVMLSMVTDKSYPERSRRKFSAVLHYLRPASMHFGKP